MTAQEALHTYFGYDSFRPMQEEIIQSVLDGKDTLALLPTGGGKSLCFQVPTMGMAAESSQRTSTHGEKERTLCLVVTPLVALMKDQVENLKKRDIHAAAVYTGMTYDQQQVALDNCQYGPYHFLYVSPERLENTNFRIRLERLPIGLIAVDEAHCISQWGYDFRPSYLKIAEIREKVHCPVLALTATATPEVVVDIQEKLGFKAPNVFRKSFVRSNLTYVVRHVRSEHAAPKPQELLSGVVRTKDEELLHILKRVPGSAIVYVRNRKRTEELAGLIGLDNATFYHAGLLPSERVQRQEMWKQGQKRIIVCTNAFGMGIDKPDVRLVVHYDLPDSIEAYFQEAGRAGRDEQQAYVIDMIDKIWRV